MIGTGKTALRPGEAPGGTHQLSADEHAYRLAGRRKAMVSDAVAEFRATFDTRPWWKALFVDRVAVAVTEEDRKAMATAFILGMKAQRDIDEELKGA